MVPTTLQNSFSLTKSRCCGHQVVTAYQVCSKYLSVKHEQATTEITTYGVSTNRTRYICEQLQ